MKNASISKIIEFVDELEKQPSLDIDQVWDYAQWSGRLNSLGYGEYQERFLQTYPEEQINAILKSRINEGLEDITEAFGEYLAVEIFTVQDFVCFVNHAPTGLIHDDVKQLLDFWVRTAEVQDLDEEAAQTLEVFLDSFPIPEEEQLDIVSAPLTKDALDFWDKALEPITEIIAEKSKDNVLDLKLWDEKPDPLIERIKKDEGWLLTINEQLEASEKLGRYYLNTGDKEPVKHFLGSLMEEGMEDNFFYCLYQKVKVLFDFLRTYPRDVPEKYAELLYVYYFLASLGKKYIYSAELLKFLPEMENFFNHNFGDIYGIYSRRAESIPVYWEAFEDDEEVEE